MKRLTIGLTATAIITLGVFAFVACEKEEMPQNKNNGLSCIKAETQKWYQLTLCITSDNRNGIRCVNVPWKPSAYGCSGPHSCEALKDERNQPDGNTNECNYSSEHAQNLLDEIFVVHGGFKHEKPFILHYWELFDYLYQNGFLMQTPEELFESATDLENPTTFIIQ